MTYSSELAAQRLHALINSRPSSPSINEMEEIIAEAQKETAEAQAWPLGTIEAGIRDTALGIFDIEKIAHLDQEYDDAHNALEAKIIGLTEQMPDKAGTLAEIIARAEIAWFYSNLGTDFQLADIKDGDAYEQAAAQLIRAVLEFAGLAKVHRLEA